MPPTFNFIKHPARKIIHVERCEDDTHIEYLECGHDFTIKGALKPGKARKCTKCTGYVDGLKPRSVSRSAANALAPQG